MRGPERVSMPSLDIGAKIRAARRQQKLSLRELAAKADVSASLISQIEGGKINPSVATLYNITSALSLRIDTFFAGNTEKAANIDEERPPHTHHLPAASHKDEERGNAERMGLNTHHHKASSPVVRPMNRAIIELMGGVTWARLTAEQERGIEFLEICYDVGADSGAAFQHHQGREFGLILEGELQLELGFDRYVLHAGDSIIFDSTTPHRLANIGHIPVRAVWVVFKQL